MKLIRVVAPHFVAGFESDGIVRRTAPILKRALLGKTDDQARKYIKRKGWKASVVPDQMPMNFTDAAAPRQPDLLAAGTSAAVSLAPRCRGSA